MSNNCVLTNTATPLLSSMQTPEDCKKRVCDGQGGVMVVPDFNDVPPPPDPCHAYICGGNGPTRDMHGPALVQ